AVTGNYTFFNLLTILLCVPLFDMKVEPSRWFIKAVGAVLIALGLLQILTMTGLVPRLPEPAASIEFRAQTLNIVNRYGLFAVMTTSRREIIIEGSDDGVDWKP